MTPPKLTVDAEGRVHGPNVTWNSPWPCRNGDDSGMSVPSGVLGMLVHTQVGNNPGSVEWFNNGASQASAHFCVAQDGSVVQMGSVNGWKAWHCAEGNPHWYGCEMADDGRPANPLTAAQIAAAAQLLELLSRDNVGRFALQITDSTSTEGLGWHGMGGAVFGGHYDCPGDTRKAQRPQIVALAKSIRAGNSPPAVRKWTAKGMLTLAALSSADLHETPAAVLARTCTSSPGRQFAAGLVTYLDTVFAGDAGMCPKGVTWHYPRGSVATTGSTSLQEIATAHGCEVAVILELTCEAAGGVFPAANAAYVGEVLARSAIRVPAGTVLYY